MSLSRRDLILTAAAAASLPGAAFAAGKDDAKPVPAKKVFPYLDMYLGIPAAERSRFVLAYYLKVNGKPGGGQAMWLVNGGQKTALPIASDGGISRLPTLAELNGGATIEADKKAADDKFQISMEMQPVARLGETMAAGELNAAVEQCGAAIRKKAGLIGFAVPRIEQVVFIGAGSGTAVLAGGKTAPLPVVKGQPVYQPAALPGVQSLKFARVPARAMLTGKAKS